MADSKLKSLTVKEVAAELNIALCHAYQLMRVEGFPSFRVGKSWRASAAGLEEWIQKQMKEAN